jgi:transposase
MDTKVESGGRKGRPNYPSEFKQRLALAACEPGVSVSKLAQAHGVNANMVFKWRRELRASQEATTTPEAAALLPVVVRPESMLASLPIASVRVCPIEIVIGDATVRVNAEANAALLRLVLQSLRA